MGEDLLISSLCFKEKGFKPKVFEKRMISNVRKIPIKDYIDYFDYKHSWNEEELLDKSKKIDLYSQIEETIRDVFKAINENYRTVSWIKHKGDIIYLSGGMSWGDSPSDTFNDFCSFINLPNKLLKLGGVII